MAGLTATAPEYIGRTVDLLMFDGATATGEVQLEATLVTAGESGATITGISKLVQRVILELLTERGSLTYAPTRGTLFMQQIRAGMIQTTRDLYSSFSSAEVDLRNNLIQEENTDIDPADERYKKAILLSAELIGDTANLSIQVISAADTERTVIYPLRTGL